MTTSLMRAVAEGNVELAKALLDSGIQSGINDVYESEAKTPLVLAIEKQNLDLIRLLLEHGAKEAINTPVKVLDAAASFPRVIEKTPLMCAIDTGNLEIVNLLVENGAMEGEKAATPENGGNEAKADGGEG